ncbi:MAG: hypothetical protein ACRDJ4_15050 [Actinomycetota bacterium]
MSVSIDHDVPAKILEVIDNVSVKGQPHVFGRPYITAYQLAIALDQRHPQIRAALGLPLGGVGIGDQHSFAPYLANQLSTHIQDHGDAYQVEGAFLSNQHVEGLTFGAPDGRILASFVQNGADLSMFRRRVGA